MKKSYSFFLFIVLSFFGINSQAQCISCTATISSVYVVEVIDMKGKKHLVNKINTIIGINKVAFDVSKLAQGTYILNVIESDKLQSRSLFSVSR